MSLLRLSAIRVADAWAQVVFGSRPWVLALYSVFLPLLWLGCRRVGPAIYQGLDVYDGGRLALLAASVAPCLWIGLFSARLYAMPSRSESWFTHDFQFLMTLPLPIHRVLFSTAAVWTFGDLPLAASVYALLSAFMIAVGARGALAVTFVVLFFWMVLVAFIFLGLGRLAYHRQSPVSRRIFLVLCLLLSLAVLSGGRQTLPEPDSPELALVWELRPLPEPEAIGLLERSVEGLEPVLQTYRQVAFLASYFPPYHLYRAASAVADGDRDGWIQLLRIALVLLILTVAPLILAESLCLSDSLALVHPGEEEESSSDSVDLRGSRRQWLTGLDAKEAALWKRFWVGPAALAAATSYMTWYLLTSGYTVLSAAKMLGLATWMVGSMAGDSLGWERRGLVLCQTLPLSSVDILSAKARWAALIGVATLVVPFASVCIFADAEPFTELIRGVLILTFLVFVAAHAGVSLGALLRDMSGSGSAAMGPLLGALLWLGLCAAMVAQVFFTTGYAIFSGLFFDLLLVGALWQRACVALKYQHDTEETRRAETTFADAVMVFLTAYLLVTVIVLRAQAMGASDGSLSALRTYLLTALFPVVLAALTWMTLKNLPAPVASSGRQRGWLPDLAAGGLLACVTTGLTLVYSYGSSRLGWTSQQDLGSSVTLMRRLVEGLPFAPVLLFLLVGVLTPLAEEGFFRGLLFRGLRQLQPDDCRVAILLSSLAFGLLHPASHFPVIFTMGTLLALLVEHRGLRPAILAHGIHNLVMAGIFLAMAGGG